MKPFHISMQKIEDIDALLPATLTIKESCNLIRQEHFGLTWFLVIFEDQI